MKGRTFAAAALAAAAIAGLALGAPARAEENEKDPLLSALVQELERTTANIEGKSGEEPLYYLSYRAADGRMFSISASYGALTGGLEGDDPYAGRMRFLDVSARVGSRKLDNTHKIRGEFDFSRFGGFGNFAVLPVDDDTDAMRVAIWRATDRAYRMAVNQLIKVKTNKAVKVEEEDQADDFSGEEPQVHLGARQTWSFERTPWKERLKRLSALFKAHPAILTSSVSMQGGAGTQYFVDSDGARIREPRFFARLTVSAAARADDGMDLALHDSFEAISPDRLPSEEEIEKKAREMIARLEALRAAPVVEPYAGPAIIVNRAAAVFFHEIFGHRVEGHRQKDEDEGQTFTKKVGKRVMPEFISVVDDPTRKKFGETVLNGHYLFDDEGVPARRASLVESGILKGFLMGRSPIEGFPRSNGHGRAQPGMAPVARQGALMVESSSRVSFADLRGRLIGELKKRGKPYGLMFEDIAGGFTFTGRAMPQAFKVIPLVVYRVYADGRPDELVRGVDLVGTPLASLEKILVTGDDYEVFNGYCGAESGFVPVSAVAPSLLVAEMEVEKKEKGHDRPPLLAPPLHAKDGKAAPPERGPAAAGAGEDAPAKDPVFRALEDEVRRAKGLSMERVDKPYWVSAFANDSESFSTQAVFGALGGRGKGSNRSLAATVRVGSPELDNTNFAGGGGMPFGFGFGRGSPFSMSMAPDEPDYDALRHALWLQLDSTYKQAAETIASKRAYLETNVVKERPPDFAPAPVVDVVLPREKLAVDAEKWTKAVRDASAVFRAYPHVHQGAAAMQASVSHQYFVSTDPGRHRFAEPLASVGISAETQAQDGMPIRVSYEARGRTEADLPEPKALVAEAHALARRLEALAKAPHARDYTGPVLFTGRAAATFFLKTVGDPLSQPRAALGAPKEGRLVDRVGKRIASPLLTVRDDPTRKEWRGKPLLGHFPVDDDGVKPVPITLIEKGVLKTTFMSRVPTEKVQASNGHSRAGQGSVGNLFVEAQEPLSRGELKKRLIELASEEDLDHGLLVEELSEGGGDFGPGGMDFDMSMFFGGGGGDRGAISLPPPLVMLRVYEDGREELVRGATFKGLQYRVLRDIEALGDDPVLLQATQFGQRVSVVAPSVLVRGLELKRPREEHRKPPFSPRPAFRDAPAAAPAPEKKAPEKGREPQVF